MCTHNICFEQNMKIVKTNQLNIVVLKAVKYSCMLHGRVFVMKTYETIHQKTGSLLQRKSLKGTISYATMYLGFII